MQILSGFARLVRRLLKPLGYALAIVLPPLLAFVISFGSVAAQNPFQQPPAFEGPLPAPPAHDPAKRTALIVAGNTATESSDLLGPYQVLAASGAFNVYVVAPERRLTPLVPQPHCCGALDLVPHYSFDEYERAVGATPDLVVVPYIPRASQEDAAVLSWLRERPGEQTVVLSICGGAQMVAQAGLLAGRQATSHQTILPILEQSHPEVSWVRGLRYVEDGRFISSAGVTSGVDATLYTLQRFLGRPAALETAQRVGYPHTQFLDDRTWLEQTDSLLEPELAASWPTVYRWDDTKIGLVLSGGVGEIELASIIDTYPRALTSDVYTIAPERAIVRTRHGLDLLPRFDLASAPRLDRVLLPGQPDPAVAGAVERWAGANGGPAVERIHQAGGYPYDLTFADLARQETRPVAAVAARWLEYPIAQQALPGSDWPLGLVLRPVGLGLLGLAAALGLPRLLQFRRPRSAQAGEHGAGGRLLPDAR